ncbi:MAG TPA: mannitol dehydrogenase family protein [Candidatus Obscuribacterales bacterium]
MANSATATAKVANHRVLSRSVLGQLPAHVKVPNYDSGQLSPGILHIGAGNFAASLLGSIVDDCLADDPNWGIVAASIRSDGMISALNKQDCLYVLIERTNGERQASVRAPIVEALFGPDDPERLVSLIADPRIKAVTLTISNKGYCFAPNGGLDLKNGDVVHDLCASEKPRTVYWYLSRGLALRKDSCAQPLTIISLDNIESNSRALRKALYDYVAESNPELAQWMDDNVAFPVTLVDRITPESTVAFRHDATEFLGFESTVIIPTEKFRQLVIEKSPFPLPAWEKAGVTVVDDCSQYWQQKFFCLNGGHQIVGIPAQRLGIAHIHEAMAESSIAGLIELAHRELASIIPGSEEHLDKYMETIRHRFSDSALNDTVVRVTARTTSKVSERLLAAVERSLALHGKVLTAHTFVTAVWLLNLDGDDEFGQEIPANDADSEKLIDVHQDVLTWARSEESDAAEAPTDVLKSALIQAAEILKDTRFARMANNPVFIKELTWAVLQINRLGTQAAIQALLAR